MSAVTVVREWSKLQLAVFEFAISGYRSAIVEAVAGSGKTTTLVETVKRLVAHNPIITICFTAFNKAIADEIGVRLEGVGDPTRVMSATFHALGNRAWSAACPKWPKIEGRKLLMLSKDTLNIPYEYSKFAQKAVSLAKNWAVGITCDIDDRAAWNRIVERFDLADMLSEKSEQPTAYEISRRVEEGIDHAIRLMKESIRVAFDVIDFDDQLYMPLYRRVSIRQFDVVMVDEAQDTNPTRLLFAKAMLKPEGRLIAVGDPRQAIYGFAGADADSLDRIADTFDCVRLPLNVSYRCPRAVVAHAQQWVSHIESAPNAPEGSVTEMTVEEFNAAELRPTDAILCRNMRPLVELAFALIRRRIGCIVEGRDIGENLIALSQKWKVKTISALGTKLESYREREVAKLLKKNPDDEAAVEALNDKIDTLRVIMSSCQPTDSLDTLAATIRNMFGDTNDAKRAPILTLCTAHRSKGREWDRVYLYGRNKYMPSKYAKQDWQRVQESNLIYVAVTRAKSELIEVMV